MFWCPLCVSEDSDGAFPLFRGLCPPSPRPSCNRWPHRSGSEPTFKQPDRDWGLSGAERCTGTIGVCDIVCVCQRRPKHMYEHVTAAAWCLRSGPAGSREDAGHPGYADLLFFCLLNLQNGSWWLLGASVRRCITVTAVSLLPAVCLSGRTLCLLTPFCSGCTCVCVLLFMIKHFWMCVWIVFWFKAAVLTAVLTLAGFKCVWRADREAECVFSSFLLFYLNVLVMPIFLLFAAGGGCVCFLTPPSEAPRDKDPACVFSL